MHVLCTLVYSLVALQADFEDPFLGPPTGPLVLKCELTASTEESNP
jgi:hypothetical protein